MCAARVCVCCASVCAGVCEWVFFFFDLTLTSRSRRVFGQPQNGAVAWEMWNSSEEYEMNYDALKEQE